MSTNKTKKKFGILLTLMLLFQLSYHTIHVFTQHGTNSHIEHSVQDIQINKTTSSCELCAKLLGQTLYFWVYPTLLLSNAFPLLPIRLEGIIYALGAKKNHFLRGPPSLPIQ